ncbi:MAG: hypothetical protein G8237_01515 [Magnetococcales bacterium]|nr:hypothetical protein [Magnetococcales bacterium]NGZ05015.1 hypothetical protein [Magnetococcales bacterium]
MIHILYSADYELYLGRITTSEEEVLITPTNALLATCSELDIPLTLFADVACFWRYRELNRPHFPDQAEAQLVQAIRHGHDVQTHLHPHWHHTRIEDRTFLFDPTHYLAGTCSSDPLERAAWLHDWLQRAREYLTRLLIPHNPHYRCLAFRAGGYGLQPDTEQILHALIQTGYRIDSSIIPGLRLSSPMQQIDFTRVPNQANYWLSPTHGLDQAAPQGEGLWEIPIAACRLPPGVRWRVRLPEATRQALAILTARPPLPTRGTPCNQPSIHPASHSAGRLKQAYWRFRAIFANDFQRLELGTDPDALLACLHHYRSIHNQQQPIFLSMNIHPKGIHPPHLTALARFHRTLMQPHPGQVRAITFQQAWEILQNTTPGS